MWISRGFSYQPGSPRYAFAAEIRLDYCSPVGFRAAQLSLSTPAHWKLRTWASSCKCGQRFRDFLRTFRVQQGGNLVWRSFQRQTPGTNTPTLAVLQPPLTSSSLKICSKWLAENWPFWRTRSPLSSTNCPARTNSLCRDGLESSCWTWEQESLLAGGKSNAKDSP